MVIAAVLILTVLSFWAIARPFFRNGDNSERSWLYEFEDSTVRSGSVPSMVKQLETDYKTGILSEEDYRSRRNELQSAAAGGLELKTEGASGLDEVIENRIAGLRSGGKVAADDEIEEKIRQLRRNPAPAGRQSASTGGTRQAKGRFCSQCGTRLQSGDRFCARCGKQLT